MKKMLALFKGSILLLVLTFNGCSGSESSLSKVETLKIFTAVYMGLNQAWLQIPGGPAGSGSRLAARRAGGWEPFEKTVQQPGFSCRISGQVYVDDAGIPSMVQGTAAVTYNLFQTTYEDMAITVTSGSLNVQFEGNYVTQYFKARYDGVLNVTVTQGNETKSHQMMINMQVDGTTVSGTIIVDNEITYTFP